ncbi:MAG: hypothetical protein AB1646_23585 [Thermodesulfobacteriota bacterium]
MPHHCYRTARYRWLRIFSARHDKWTIRSRAVSLFCGTVLSAVWAPLCAAASYAPGEGQAGFLYRITHLPIAAYGVMLLVVILAVLNLFHQGWLSGTTLSFSALARKGLDRGVPARRGKGSAHRGKGAAPTARGPSSSLRVTGLDEPAGEIVSIRRIQDEAPAPDPVVTDQPTPLDGINHPLPVLTPPRRPPAPVLETKAVETPPQVPSATPFRFTSAVDLPTREEIQRREKEKLVVTGSVLDSQGTGLPSVLVYLTDEEGRRVGQSARTREDSGEFKVIAHERGRYALRAYKRGFRVEGDEVTMLPIESGRIEGYTLRMVPEGCVVKGRISDYPLAGTESTLSVRCADEDGHFSRSATVEASGGFLIEGVPSSTECFLEIVDASGRSLARSSTFSTVNRKELAQDITVSAPSGQERDAPGAEVVWDEAAPRKD